MNRRHFAWILAAGLACLPPVVEGRQGAEEQKAAPQRAERGSDDKRSSSRGVKWWLETKERAELGITDQQSARIEQIWQATIEEQRGRYRELQKLEPPLAQLIKDGTADPAVVAREVDRVETLWSQARKTRIVTLYRMHRELTPDQRAKLKAMDERREAERRKTTGSDGRRH